MKNPDFVDPAHATLADVAKKARVSLTTASMALNNVGRVAVQTRTRIREAAESLGYVPNPAARLLGSTVHGSTTPRFLGTVGLLMAAHLNAIRESSHPAKASIAAFEARIGELGYHVDPIILEPMHTKPGVINRILQARGIRGVLLIAENLPVHIFPIDWSGLSAVVSSPDEHAPLLHCGVTNHFEDAYLATSKVLEYGYKKPVFLTSKQNRLANPDHGLDQFIGGYEAALFRGGCVGPRRNLIALEKWDWSKALAKIRRSHADAVIFDSTSLHLPEMLRANYMIPREFGVAFLSVYPEASPDAAGIFQSGAVRDRLLADLLASMLARGETGIPEHPSIVHVSGRWVDGATLPRRCH